MKILPKSLMPLISSPLFSLQLIIIAPSSLVSTTTNQPPTQCVVLPWARETPPGHYTTQTNTVNNKYNKFSQNKHTCCGFFMFNFSVNRMKPEIHWKFGALAHWSRQIGTRRSTRRRRLKTLFKPQSLRHKPPEFSDTNFHVWLNLQRFTPNL